MSNRNIAIIWDFDGTLTPQDSTTEVVEYFLGKGKAQVFWESIKKLNGSEGDINWEKILASDAPTWMYMLSKYAHEADTPLTTEFFKKITDLVKFFPNTENFLRGVKSLSQSSPFKEAGVEIHHFIISAGLKEYIDEIVPDEIFSGIWGCRYRGTYGSQNEDKIESVPVFCMDETMKTRALFEISKGVFKDQGRFVNDMIDDKSLWCPFGNIIYIGDGPTDIPALSLTRDRGGFGIVVYNPTKDMKKVKERLKDMSADDRCDLITEANFMMDSKLFTAIRNRCNQILNKYQAHDFSR